MKAKAESLLGEIDTITGKNIRVTQQGVFVDGVLWHGKGEGVFILDITEDQ